MICFSAAATAAGGDVHPASDALGGMRLAPAGGCGGCRIIMVSSNERRRYMFGGDAGHHVGRRFYPVVLFVSSSFPFYSRLLFALRHYSPLVSCFLLVLLSFLFSSLLPIYTFRVMWIPAMIASHWTGVEMRPLRKICLGTYWM